MSHGVIVQEVADLNRCLAPCVAELSKYVFGYSYGDNPKGDNGELIPVDTFINNGLCHAYGLLLKTRLADLGVCSYLTGTPSHVWIESGGEWYDSAGTPETSWPDELFDYDNRETLLREFPHTYEGLLVLSEALSKVNGARHWCAVANRILEE